jgi:Spy/CpxP family protein refolding chaperone
MRNPLTLIALALAAVGCAAQAPLGHSAYAGQESREIKSLSPEDVSGLLAGKGLGYAKPAELNGYPGPLHVLELAANLQLSDEQRARTEALFASMQAKAKEAGQALVAEERALDRLFASRSVDAGSLAASLERIGKLQARVREAHLEAHLAQSGILTPGQVAHYARLRGYEAGGHTHRH